MTHLKRGRAYDPWAHATMLGLTVIHARIDAVDLDGRPIIGLYDHHAGTITLDERLSDRAARCTLAHEVQHAIYCDPATRDRRRYRTQEARANRAAALLLIDDAELALAEQAVGMSASLLADELDVVASVIKTYRVLAATGDVMSLGIDKVA